ncbi:MAG: hypothetical protein HQM00_07820 [Magnetococcales bacterium]|nr:hypothetical protein [Magnetococcales bacterium]
MKRDGHDEIPVNLELLSDDNRVGVVLVIGCLLFGVALADRMGWSSFFTPDGWAVTLLRPCMLVFGGVLIVLAARRLLVPGCRTLVRVNFGGITDIRLVTSPIRWSFIVEARRPPGVLFYLLPGVVLQLHEDFEPGGVETFWSRLLHMTCRLRGKHILFLASGTLDHSADQLLEAINSHLRARHKARR